MTDPDSRLHSEKLTVARRRDLVRPERAVVDDLIVSEPVMGTPSMTVQEAAALITERGQNYLLVPLGDRRHGLVTDADLRARVVARGRDLGTAVGDLVTGDCPTVPSGTPAVDALTEILDRDQSVLPVVDAAGEVVGVVAAADFVAAPSGSGMALRGQVSRAATVAVLQERARRIPQVMADLLRRGEPAHEIGTVVSLINDAVVRRALELVLAEHDELNPDALTWLSLGSNARREPVLTSDVDSAVSFDDAVADEEIADYRGAFAEVDDVLRGAGMTIDANGAIASMPLFARTHTQWRTAARRWLAEPLENKGMIFTSLLLDGRPIWGDPGLSAVAEVFGDLRSHPATLSLLLQEALADRARLRSFRDVMSGRGGTFDIKQHAVTPLVNIARWAALSVESTVLETRSRLTAAAGSPMLPEDHSATLVEVFDVLQRIRLTYQVAQFDRGEKCTDLLEMKRLSPLDRSLVAQAVREIAGVQRRMGNLSHYLPITEQSR
ncbi:putative nucleotidyltransferase substrate binding domain-containing protein [Gordonia sp. CPCC 206044]|uniref:putative nucleotidyltransferase substrate binding domain-containing protein n=1 Tax=Gordonia sp. CPCC 206044 TaxID=3140793 RepID=UPI003AF3FBA9